MDSQHNPTTEPFRLGESNTSDEVNDGVNDGVEILCRCGRSPQKQHCPRCGSLSFYAMMRCDKISLTNSDNVVEQLDFQVYRCRRCGRTYNEWEWKNKCEAPLTDRLKTDRLRQERSPQFSKAQEELRQAVFSGNQTERLGAIEELLHKHAPDLLEKRTGKPTSPKTSSSISGPKDDGIRLVDTEPHD
jgi:hypothetical protein